MAENGGKLDKRGLGDIGGNVSAALGGGAFPPGSIAGQFPEAPSGVESMIGDWAASSGIDFSDPTLKDIAKFALSQYLTAQGVPPFLADQIADMAIEQLFAELQKQAEEQEEEPEDEEEKPEEPEIEIPPPEIPEYELADALAMVPQEYQQIGSNGSSDDRRVDDVVRTKTNVQLANEAVDINRKIKDKVKGFLPPMNWIDRLPDWPAFSYTAIIQDQTRAGKEFIMKGLPSNDDIELQIEARKFPYKKSSNSTLMKGKINSGSKTKVVGMEIPFYYQTSTGTDYIEESESPITPPEISLTEAIPTVTSVSEKKFEPVEPPFEFPQTVRDDLTDQKNPALDLVDAQNLVDEFLVLGRRIYDSGTDNPHIFGFDDINSKYEKDKNIMLANLKQFKVNVRKMEYIHNIIENNSNNYLIKKINYRNDLNVCSITEEHRTRYLREKLLAWYNEEADPATKVWKDYHWIPGEPGYIEYLLTVGDYEWYDNLVAGLEDSVARLEDLEATMDLFASMANIQGTIEKYKTAIEEMEAEVEAPGEIYYTTFTDEIIDHTMLKELLGLSEIIGSINGEITPIRAELESLRWDNQGLLETVREMSPSFMAYPIIWSTLNELVSQVIADIDGPLNTLILDRYGDYETEGKHSSPSHLALDLTSQLVEIVEAIEADVQDIIDRQAALPQMGLNILDSMLNKINEIRMFGPLCSIPFHYQVAIDNVNAAERLYNDIWSDVFDCWEREYITRVWRVVTEHHIAGVIPAIHYGKPLFSAECPHHLPLLLAPVPVDYRDVPINYLSANCRKNFNFMTSWLTSALYAIGIKRVALAQVINDTSLNGNDENIEWLAMLNELNAKNNVIRDEMDNIIGAYDTADDMLPKSDLAEIVAAKELSPRHYSNQVLLNLSSQLHLLNTYPITTFDVATNENRVPTVISNSEPVKWDALVVPTTNTYSNADEAVAEFELDGTPNDTSVQITDFDFEEYLEALEENLEYMKIDDMFDLGYMKWEDILGGDFSMMPKSGTVFDTIKNIFDSTIDDFKFSEFEPDYAKIFDLKEIFELPEEKIEIPGLTYLFSELYVPSEPTEIVEMAKELPDAANEIIALESNTISTTGGSAEEVKDDTNVNSDSGIGSEGFYVGEVDEFMPWHYMTPDWDTQKKPVELPIVPVEPLEAVVPSASEFLDDAPIVYDAGQQELLDEKLDEFELEKPIEEEIPHIVPELPKKTEEGPEEDESPMTSDEVDYRGMMNDFLMSCGIDVTDPMLKDLAKMALTDYLIAQGVPSFLAEQLADAAVEEISSQLSGDDSGGQPSSTSASTPSVQNIPAGIVNDFIAPNIENMDSNAKSKAMMSMKSQFELFAGKNGKTN